MSQELLKKFKALKGKPVVIDYGITLSYTGVLISWTSGANAKVWLSDHRSDISIPTNQVRDIKEVQ